MRIGVIAGNFDVIHPGYVRMFQECEANCDQLIILLHDDPTIERPTKLKPILSTYERREMLTYLVKGSIVMTYNTEKELKFLLSSIEPDVRFLGIDYLNNEFTGKDLNIPIHYISRQHGWSTTRFKKSIADEIQRSSNI
jgi:glycerol-3-phosphate cytidylyltransferase